MRAAACSTPAPRTCSPTSPPAVTFPFVETQAGKGAPSWEHPLNFGSPGVTGSACGNAACAAADLVIGVGTRFQDFTTGCWTVFANPDRKLVSINLHGYDALKHGALGVVGDARVTLEKIDAALGDMRFAAARRQRRAPTGTRRSRRSPPRRRRTRTRCPPTPR